MLISFDILNTSLRLSLTLQKRNRVLRSWTICSNSQSWWVTELKAKLRLPDFRMCALERDPNPFTHTMGSHPSILIPHSWVCNLLPSSFSPHSYWPSISPQWILPPDSPHHFHNGHISTEEESDGGSQNSLRLMPWSKATVNPSQTAFLCSLLSHYSCWLLKFSSLNSVKWAA